MADILIRDVEMPNSCEKCPFNDYEQGYCFAVWKFIESGWPEFSLNVGDMKTRHPQCHLDQLPEGHGRLIDENYLLALISDEEHFGCLNVSDILNAPTIVPAEGGTDECSEN